MSEPTLTQAEIRANIAYASFKAWGDAVPEVARRHRFREILTLHGRVSVDELDDVLNELMAAV